MHAVTGMQWDLLDSCDSICDYTYYLNHDRLKFQGQLKTFFASSNSMIWIRLLKAKLGKPERVKFREELKFN
jgi:hypothetical protein